ncbi:MAG: YitT family protein [Oscillospiraceae bacterium]|nr:YitT family protein [Oscillospiraceae bacterium]
MDSIKKQLSGKSALSIVVKYLIIVVGSLIFAASFQFFLYPNSIVSGGVTGIAQIINRLTGLPVGVLSIIMNVPLFIIAWRHFGLDFIVSSFVAMTLFSVFVDVFAVLDIAVTDDAMLASIIGGVIKGIGLGMIYYVGSTTGGIDIVVRLARRRYPHINFGTLMLVMDAVIVAAYALIFKIYDSAMYSLICMFVMSKVVDLVLYGLDNSSICYIISEHSEDIVKEITFGELHRGVTLLSGEGAYTHEKRPVVMCVIKRPQIAAIRRLVRTLDPNAFLIVTDAKNVFGKGFDSINDNN